MSERTARVERANELSTHAHGAGAAAAAPADALGSDVADLRELARKVRVEVVKAAAAAGGGHVGGSLSAADILVALYFRELRVRPDDPTWDGRDRFVLSKGHGSLALYATLALRGFIPLGEMATFGRIDSRLQGHPDMTRLPSLDMSTGALGAGFSAAVGMALGSRIRGTSERTYTLLGDGECQEGEVWEAAFIAARYGLANLLAVVDFNGMQVTGWPASRPGTSLPPWPLRSLIRQWSASGWAVLQADGHDFPSILAAFDRARSVQDRPVVIVAKTVKGRGVSFMRGWHGRVPTRDELGRALEELGETG